MFKKNDYPYSEKIAWLRLIRSENVGPKTFHNLLQLFGSAENALEMLPDLALRGGLKRSIKIADKNDIESELESIKQLGGEIICAYERNYPTQLLQIEDYPPVLTLLGNATLLNEKIIAIVGARDSSITGINFAKKIAEELGAHKITVISGLAKGIDGAAHLGSLQSGTIAVIAGGINHIYPPENLMLYKQIAQKGLIISEQPLGSAPIAKFFPMRNRIISALSRAVIIVEAAKKSGSLITAKFALSQNKKIYAVPGSPLDPRYGGTNQLIREGKAVLYESVEEIINDVDNISYSFNDNKIEALNVNAPLSFSENEYESFRNKLRASLSFTAVSINDILIHTKIPIQALNLLLIELELAGKIERTYGNKFKLIE